MANANARLTGDTGTGLGRGLFKSCCAPLERESGPEGKVRIFILQKVAPIYSMTAPLVRRITNRITDPFGFHEALQDLSLAPEDLPGLTRECRQAGHGT